VGEFYSLQLTMKELSESKRRFLKGAGLTAGAVLRSSGNAVGKLGMPAPSGDSPAASPEPSTLFEYV
jgi:hypothetical protein